MIVYKRNSTVKKWHVSQTDFQQMLFDFKQFGESVKTVHQIDGVEINPGRVYKFWNGSYELSAIATKVSVKDNVARILLKPF